MKVSPGMRNVKIGKDLPSGFRITGSFFGYLLTAVLMLLFFLCLRFPGGAVRDYLKASAEARYPNMLVAVESIVPVIPPGVSFKNIHLAFRDRPDATLHVTSLTLSPGWSSVFQGKAAVNASAFLYGGEFHVSGEPAKAFSMKKPFLTSARFEGIKVEKCLMLQDFLARQVSGTLKGAFTANDLGGPLKNVVGKIDASVSNGSYQLMENLAGFDSINFSRMDLKMELKNGALKISNITVNGDKLRITLKGNILLADAFAESRMDLTGSLELQGLGGRRMPIAIGGVLGKPTIKLM